MNWAMTRCGLGALAVLAVVGCDRVGLEPAPAASAPSAAAAPTYLDPDIRPFAGRDYAAFSQIDGLRQYSVASLRLSAPERARFEAGMAVQEPSVVAAGGGAEALVFSGCAVSGCAHGRSVLAIDTRTGATFVGVAGQGGSEALIPNDRLEALLRVTSPTMRWEDPVRAPQMAALPENAP
jgi:hypothetical protein